MTLRKLAAVLAASALILTACSSDKPDEFVDPDTGEATPVIELSPLTGLELPDGRPDNPVFVVKVENTIGGRPQYALDKADLVVEEMVEAGLTRLAALYWTELPTKVGHIRSMRNTDVGIAAPVGGQIVASGAANPTYRYVDKAKIEYFSEDHGAPGFSSDPAKFRPYNRLVDLTKIAEKAVFTEIVNPYFEWTRTVDEDDAEPEPEASTDPSASAAPQIQTRTATSADVRFSPATTTTFGFADGTWQRTNGHAAQGQDFRADTMIVIFAKVVDAGYRDSAGSSVPETKFEGTGKATILNGDQALDVTWTKEAVDSTVTFTDANGDPVTIDPGKIWINLVPDTGSLTLR